MPIKKVIKGFYKELILLINAYKTNSTNQVIIALALLLAAMPMFSARNVSDGAQLGVLVIGTIVQSEKTGGSVALIKEKSNGRVRAVKAGFKIMSKFDVHSVTEKYMVLKDKQKNEYLVYQNKFKRDFIDGKATFQKPSAGGNSVFLSNKNFYKEEGFERNGNNVKFTSGFRDEIVGKKLQTVLMQATAEPNIENGRVSGFKFSQIDPGSIYDKAGVQNGDVITHVNGIPLKDAGSAISLLKRLKQSSAVEFDLKRGGKQQTFSLSEE